MGVFNPLCKYMKNIFYYVGKIRSADLFLLSAHIHGARQRRDLRSRILDSNAASLRFHSYALFIPCQSSMYQVKSFLSLVSCKNFIFLEGCDMLNGNRKGTSANPAS